eukprot:4830179-Amphidinium_carterae.1
MELRMWMRVLTALQDRAWPAKAVLRSMEKAIPTWWQWGQAWHASAFIQQSLDDEDFCSWSIWATENHIKHLRQKYGNAKAAAWREWCRKAFEPHQGGWRYLRDPQSKLQPAPMVEGNAVPLTGMKAYRDVADEWWTLWAPHVQPSQDRVGGLP